MKHKLSVIVKKYHDIVKKVEIENYKNLSEDKLDKLVTDKIVALSQADPDQHQLKNTDWIIKTYLKSGFLWEDVKDGDNSKVYHTLTNFLKYRKELPDIADRDIMRHKKLAHIAELIKEYIPEYIDLSSNKKKESDNIRAREESIILKEDDYLVVIPKTKFASCFWGRNTEWCTASTESENYFDSYNVSSPLYICITPDNKKYQFHKNSSPMDENDKELTNVTDPVLIKLCQITGKDSAISAKLWNDKQLKSIIKEEAYILEEDDVYNNIPKHLLTPDLFLYAFKCGLDSDFITQIPEDKLNQEICDFLLNRECDSDMFEKIPDQFKKWEGYLYYSYDINNIPEKYRTAENIYAFIRESDAPLSIGNEIFKKNPELYHGVLDLWIEDLNDNDLKYELEDKNLIIDQYLIDLLKKDNHQALNHIKDQKILKKFNLLEKKEDIKTDIITKENVKKYKENDIKNLIKHHFEYISLLEPKQYSSKIIKYIIDNHPNLINHIPEDKWKISDIKNVLKTYHSHKEYINLIPLNNITQYVNFYKASQASNYYMDSKFKNNLIKQINNTDDIQYVAKEILNILAIREDHKILQAIFNHPDIEKVFTHEFSLNAIKQKKLWDYLPSYVINQYIPLEERLKKYKTNWSEKNITIDFDKI